MGTASLGARRATTLGMILLNSLAFALSLLLGALFLVSHSDL